MVERAMAEESLQPAPGQAAEAARAREWASTSSTVRVQGRKK